VRRVLFKRRWTHAWSRRSLCNHTNHLHKASQAPAHPPTCVYLSIKCNAFGTLWSPRCTTLLPTQPPTRACGVSSGSMEWRLQGLKQASGTSQAHADTHPPSPPTSQPIQPASHSTSQTTHLTACQDLVHRARHRRCRLHAVETLARVAEPGVGVVGCGSGVGDERWLWGQLSSIN